MLPDLLLRVSVAKPQKDEAEEDIEIHAVGVVSSLVSDATLERLSKETRNDSYLHSVVTCLQKNQPVQGRLKHFESELSAVSGVLLKGCKVVVPSSMRQEMLRRIHEGHMGLNKCKERARRLVFWPGMNTDVENVIKNAQYARSTLTSNTANPFLSAQCLRMPGVGLVLTSSSTLGNCIFVRMMHCLIFPSLSSCRTRQQPAD